MYFCKEIDGKQSIQEVTNDNLFSLYKREGFTECDKKGKPIIVETQEITE